MKRFSTGLLIGLLIGVILTIPMYSLAQQPIKLIINGQQIQCDVPPQNINGRVLVPARFVAEPLGATVEWDGTNKAVVINGEKKLSTLPINPP
jgi:multidrug efflux pump subunit AcrA (membrane-fusion protein)